MPSQPAIANNELAKTATGITGLDQITGGGLPKGRPTLVCGAAGCGKTLLAMEFLVRGVTQFNEPGVFMSFEESGEELAQNVRSLGFDLHNLVAQKKIALDHVQVERSEIEETGEYDLEGLFIRLGNAVNSIGAKRVVLDTIEALFASLPNELILRSELRRLFRWLKDKGLTAIITGERGDGNLTRHGLEEYVADCVIVLDHRVADQMSTRRLRIAKYRGSTHGTNEYPFLIDRTGISVMPITSMGLEHKVSTQRISTGIVRLDEMLDGKGYFRGSSIMVSGAPGTGKTSLGVHFADATCRRGERCLLFAYEESADQIVRNMHSLGLDLEPWLKKGLLQIHSSRPTLYGLEMHLVSMHQLIEKFSPSVVIVDPVSNLSASDSMTELKPMLMRLIDSLKSQQITGLFISLTSGTSTLEESQVGVSSLMDAWLLIRNIESNGERNRTLYVLKARGMAHSNQVREFVMSDKGVNLVDIYIGAEQVLTGTARVAQEARERARATEMKQEHERKLRDLERKRKVIDAQIAALEAERESEEAEVKRSISQETQRQHLLTSERSALGVLRGEDQPSDQAGRKS